MKPKRKKKWAPQLTDQQLAACKEAVAITVLANRELYPHLARLEEQSHGMAVKLITEKYVEEYGIYFDAKVTPWTWAIFRDGVDIKDEAMASVNADLAALAN